jgi:hypothetical protein
VFAAWKEKRMRNRLLMRELLLRAEAKRVGAPGKSGLPTEYFRREKRRLLLRNPRFAIEYRRATDSDRMGAQRGAENQEAYQQHLERLRRGTETAPRHSESS